MTQNDETQHFLNQNVAEYENLDDKDEDDGRDDDDGGWYGWLVVFCSFLCVCVLDGIGYSFGVFFESLLHELSDGHGRGILSVVGSLQIGVYSFSSPVVAKLMDRYGERRPCCVGALVSCLGLVMASYATTIPTLVLGYSVVTGIGFGLMYLPSVVIVPKYFVTKHRSLATSVVLCASGVGTFVVAPLTTALLDTYGWRGAMRGLAVLAGSCILCGAFMTQPRGHVTRDRTRDTDKPDTSSSFSCLDKLLGNHMSTCKSTLSLFLLLGLADMLSTLSLYIPYTYLPSAAMARGVSGGHAAMLISSIGVSNTLGRLGAGWLADQAWTHPLVIITMSITAAAPCLFFLSFLSQFWMLLVTSAVFGLVTGVWVSATPPALIHLLGVSALSTAFGVFTFSRGVAAMAGPPLAGMVVDTAGDKGVALLVAGGGMAASCATFTLTTMLDRRRERRAQYQQL